MSDQIRIMKSASTWVVRAGGAVLGESENALEVVEGDQPPVIYFPREDLAMAFLEKSGSRASASGADEASYYSIVTKSTTLKDAAWSYEDPRPGMEKLKGHLAFRTGDTVTVEEL